MGEASHRRHPHLVHGESSYQRNLHRDSSSNSPRGFEVEDRAQPHQNLQEAHCLRIRFYAYGGDL